MKSRIPILAGITMCALAAHGLATAEHINIMRQVQLDLESPNDDPVKWDMQVPDEGEEFSALPIDPGGARFELWTFLDDEHLSSHLLDLKYVSTYTPMAEVLIVTGDPYDVIPRTRANEGFDVYIQTSGLLADDPDAPDAAKSVRLQRRVQSYGPDGTGEDVDRGQSVLWREVLLADNKIHHFSLLPDVPTFPVPSGDGDMRGEETFTVYSLPDYQVESQQIASMFMQVWPAEKASIRGIVPGETVRFNAPPVTVEYGNMYPGSFTYTQLYPGPPKDYNAGLPEDDVPGRQIIGSQRSNTHGYSIDRTFQLPENWDLVIDQDGQWTMEIITETPFGSGAERLAHLTFNINRSIEIQGSVNTID